MGDLEKSKPSTPWLSNFAYTFGGGSSAYFFMGNVSQGILHALICVGLIIANSLKTEIKNAAARGTPRGGQA